MSDAQHGSPLTPQLLLLGAYALVVLLGIATVLVPALWDDGEEETQREGNDAAAETADPSAP